MKESQLNDLVGNIALIACFLTDDWKKVLPLLLIAGGSWLQCWLQRKRGE